jgi:hypothetical protein
MQTEGIFFYGFFGLLFVLITLRFSKRQRQFKRRENSLSYDSKTSMYIWIGLNGMSQKSDMHPAQPGGEWYEADHSGYHYGGGCGGESSGGDGGVGGD